MKRLVPVIVVLITSFIAIDASAQCAKNILSDDSFADVRQTN